MKFLLQLRNRISSLFTQLTNPISSLINTTVSNDLSADGLTWSQANPIIFDQYNNIIINAQRADGRRVFLYSNDNGTTWNDNDDINDFSNLGEIATRNSFCYDQVNQCLHGILHYNNEVVVYRKYGLVYSGTSITGITWTRGVDANTVLQSTSATGFEHVICLLVGSVVLALWSTTAGSGSNIIAVRCDISSNANAGATLANWIHIGVSGTSVIGSVPDTPSYTVIDTTAITANMYPACILLDNGDLAFIYYKSTAYYIRRAIWNGSTWASLGTATLLCNLVIAGTDGGYTLKYQLITAPIEVNNKIYVGFPVWLSNVLGDTWRLAEIATDNSSTFYNVYSVNGSHAYAPTGDITYLDNRLITSYLKTNLDTYIRVFNGIVPVGDETLMDSTYEADIPLLTRQKVNNKLLSLYRIIGSPPQDGIKTFMDFG